MNKLKTQIDYAKFTENSIVTLDIDYAERLLLELIKQYESPTIEEVKKEWEKLGYKWFENNGIIVLKQQIQFTNKFVIITLNSDKKAYWKKVDDNFNFIPFMFQEHQLLTKTMKALGWL